jgi:glycosyltransferase involved in cell wall biosynthesis
MSRTGITVHCRVRNEEIFIGAVLRAVLPMADRVLVYDTGSSDGTVDQVKAIQSPKIELRQVGLLSPIELTALRNEMADRTDTEWYIKVDGDEIYPASAVRRILQVLPQMPPTIHRLVVNRTHFYGSYNFVSGIDGLGRIFRTKTMRTGITPAPGNTVGHETPYMIEDPTRPWRTYSATMPKDVFFFHCQYMRRSMKDDQLGRLRGWRKPPFPVLPFFGPWPETLDAGDVQTRWTPALLRQWLRLNAHSLTSRTARGAWSPPGVWRLKSWPPKNIRIPAKWSELPGALRQVI